MGIFSNLLPPRDSDFDVDRMKTQVDLIREALERGEVLDMMSMLFDYGVGNHTAVIANLRKRYMMEGLGYYRVVTEYHHIRAKRTGRMIRVAKYYIPDKVKRG